MAGPLTGLVATVFGTWLTFLPVMPVKVVAWATGAISSMAAKEAPPSRRDLWLADADKLNMECLMTGRMVETGCL
jgi:hypothetical protein